MLPSRLTEATAQDVRRLVETQAAENLEFELKDSLPCRNGSDPWISGGKIGDRAKDELAAEMIAFANTEGGVLVVGVRENKTTKQAESLTPIPRCQLAAEALHQAVSDRIEPKLPMFECVGVPTEADGESGVVLMQTLPSYLAPHRHKHDVHCYVRRNDRAEPMSMQEIREAVIRSAGRLELIDREFDKSSKSFWESIPETKRRIHPDLRIDGAYVPNASDTKDWIGAWGVRLTAVALSPLHISELPKQAWLKKLLPVSYNGTGRQGYLQCEYDSIIPWRPMLRGVRRTIHGRQFSADDTIGVDGTVTRFVLGEFDPVGLDRKFIQFGMSQLVWHFAEMIRTIETVRFAGGRPLQDFGMEIEFTTSDKLLIFGYPGLTPPGEQAIPASRIVFPRYEVGKKDQFDELLTTFDRDVWNATGYDPDWRLSINWPAPSI